MYITFFCRYQQQAYAAYGQAAAANFYGSELYSRSGSTSYNMSLPQYSVSDWHPVTEYRRDYERRPRNNS